MAVSPFTLLNSTHPPAATILLVSSIKNPRQYPHYNSMFANVYNNVSDATIQYVSTT
jgi:hypothetical protein